MKEIEDPAVASDIVELIKTAAGIDKPNYEMTDEEIATIMRTIGSYAPDTIRAGEKTVLGKVGIELMLSLTLLEFPEFYVRHELAQVN